MDRNECAKLCSEHNPVLESLSVWHYLILVGMAVGTILEGLVPHSFGTFIADFKSPGNISRNLAFKNATQFQLNWLPALSSAIPSILLPLFAMVIQRFSNFYQLFSAAGFVILAISCGLSSLVTYWPILLLTYSVIYSLGASVFLTVIILISAEYFPVDHKFHVLATSLYQIGYPTAALIGNPILAILIIDYGWQHSFKFFALLNSTCGIVIACMMKPLHWNPCGQSTNSVQQSISNEKEYKESKDKSLICSPTYFMTNYQMWPWLLGKYMNYLCWYGLRTNIVTYLVRSTTFGLTRSAILITMYAGAEIVVALTASVCGDYFRGWLIHIHVFSAASLSVLMGIYTSVLSGYVSAMLLMIGIGMSIQLSLSFGYPASVEVWNKEANMNVGWIWTNVAAGIGIISSPIFSGMLMDTYGINVLFYAQCCGWIMQVFLFTLTIVIIKFKRSYPHWEYENISMDK